MEAKQVAGLARAVGITHQAAISKGTELLRLLKLKLPGNLGAVSAGGGSDPCCSWARPRAAC